MGLPTAPNQVLRPGAHLENGRTNGRRWKTLARWALGHGILSFGWQAIASHWTFTRNSKTSSLRTQHTLGLQPSFPSPPRTPITHTTAAWLGSGSQALRSRLPYGVKGSSVVCKVPPMLTDLTSDGNTVWEKVLGTSGITNSRIPL